MKFYEITGADLRTLVNEVIEPATRLEGLDRLYKVSVALDGGVKVKVNEMMWSPPLGESRQGE